MTPNGTRRSLLAAVATGAGLGAAGCLRGRTRSPPGDRRSVDDGGRTPTGTAPATTGDPTDDGRTRPGIDPPEAVSRPTVVDLTVSTRLSGLRAGEFADQRETLAGEYGSVLLDDRIHEFRTAPPDGSRAVCDVYGLWRTHVVRATAVDAAGAGDAGWAAAVPAADLSAADRRAVRTALREGAWRGRQTLQGVDVDTPESPPLDVLADRGPVLVVDLDGRLHLVLATTRLGPSCKRPDEYALERVDDAVAPVVGAVDATAPPVRRALRDAAGDAWVGDGAVRPPLPAVAGYDYAAAPARWDSGADADRRTVGLYRPTLGSPEESRDGYVLRLERVL